MQVLCSPLTVIALNDIASMAVSDLAKRTMLCLALGADACGNEGNNMDRSSISR